MSQSLDIQLDNTLIIALLIFSSMVSIVLCIYIIIKSKSGKVIHYFIGGQILTIIWTVFYIFEILAPTVEIRWFIVCIEYIPLTFVGFTFLHFSYAYTTHKMMAKKYFYLTLFLPCVGYLSVITNAKHHLFYKNFYLKGEEFGPLCWMIIITTITYLCLGAINFLNKEHLKSVSRQKQSMYFVIAMVIPVTVHILLITGVLDFGFSITLIFIPFSVLLFIVSVLKYQFLDVLPIAINDTIDGMIDGMLVVNTQGDILDYNTRFFKKAFDISSVNQCKTIKSFYHEVEDNLIDKNEFNTIFNSIDKKIAVIVKGTLNVKRASKEEMNIYVTAKPLLDYSHNKMATLLTFFDMTDIYRLYQQLEIKNQELIDANKKLKNHINTVQQLTMETERNTIMAEIHDTLGHSMMELLTLLEVTDLVMDEGQGNLLETIEEAIEKGRNSLKEVRAAVLKYKKMGGLI